MMKMAKAQKIQPKSTSRRFDTKIESATGIEKYDTAITASVVTWSQISSGSHSRQIPCGENIDESSSRSKKAHMPLVPKSKLMLTRVENQIDEQGEARQVIPMREQIG